MCGLGRGCRGFREITPTMENQLEKKMLGLRYRYEGSCGLSAVSVDVIAKSVLLGSIYIYM